MSAEEEAIIPMRKWLDTHHLSVFPLLFPFYRTHKNEEKIEKMAQLWS